MIFCDTSGLHRGGYATAKTRLMFTAVYVSTACTSPIMYRKPGDLASRLKDLAPVQRYALEHHGLLVRSETA